MYRSLGTSSRASEVDPYFTAYASVLVERRSANCSSSVPGRHGTEAASSQPVLLEIEFGMGLSEETMNSLGLKDASSAEPSEKKAKAARLGAAA